MRNFCFYYILFSEFLKNTWHKLNLISLQSSKNCKVPEQAKYQLDSWMKPNHYVSWTTNWIQVKEASSDADMLIVKDALALAKVGKYDNFAVHWRDINDLIALLHHLVVKVIRILSHKQMLCFHKWNSWAIELWNSIMSIICTRCLRMYMMDRKHMSEMGEKFYLEMYWKLGKKSYRD